MGISVIWLIDSLGRGGAEQLMPPLLHTLSALGVRSRVGVLQVREGNPLAGELEAQGFPVDLIGIQRLRNPLNIPRISHYLYKHKPDIVHTQLEFAHTLGVLSSRLLRIPVVSTLHSLPAPHVHTSAYWRHRLLWWVLRNHSRKVIAVAENARQYYIEQGQLQPESIETIYNGIDLNRFSQIQPAQLQSLRDSLGIPHTAPLLLTVAYLREPKGIQYMLQAMPRILAEIPQTHYLIAGAGAYQQPLQELTDELGITQNVTFAGFRNDIACLLSACDCFVLPSLTEALPTVLIEAMACAKPIIASRVGGVPEMIEEGKNGFLVKPADSANLAESCLRILQNPEQARIMGNAGYEYAAQNFTLNHQGQRLLELYQEVSRS